MTPSSYSLSDDSMCFLLYFRYDLEPYARVAMGDKHKVLVVLGYGDRYRWKRGALHMLGSSASAAATPTSPQTVSPWDSPDSPADGVPPRRLSDEPPRTVKLLPAARHKKSRLSRE